MVRVHASSMDGAVFSMNTLPASGSQSTRRHLGLASMRVRAARLGGQLTIMERQPGTLVQVTLPRTR